MATYGYEYRFNQFQQPNLPLSYPLNVGGMPWSLFGLAPSTFYGPIDARVPSYVRAPLQRLVYMLPRYYYNQRQDLIESEAFGAIGAGAGASGGGTYGATVIQLPKVEPTGLKKKALAKWRKAHYFDLPTALTVPSYGANRPLIRGSRDDPAGMRVPPRFLWADSLRT